MKKALAFVIVLAMICAMAVLPAFADNYTVPYVTDGLEALYEGTRNKRDGHDTGFKGWEDLSGKGNDIEDIGNSEWVTDGLSISAAKIILPDALVDVINSGEYTVEYFIKDLTVTGTNFATLINSTNDNFALFIRNSDGSIEFKNATNARTKALNGVELINGHTLAVTHKTGDKIQVAIDGEVVATQTAGVATNANTPFFIGHNDPGKSYDATIVSLRFYSKVLSEDELKANASAINHEEAPIVEKPTVKVIVGGNETIANPDGTSECALSNEDGKLVVTTNADAKDPWVSIPLDNIDTGVYKEIVVKYSVDPQMHGNNVYLRDTEVNKGYSGDGGTWTAPRMDGATERTFVIASDFPTMDGTILTGIRFPAAVAGGTLVIESVSFVGQEDTQPGTEPGTEPATQPGTEPGTEPGTQPETVPQTGDAEVAMLAVIVVLALGAAVVFVKKKSF